VDIHYPYNALFRRGTLNAFEAVHGDQAEARYIEKEYTHGRKNVHTIKEEEKEETENTKQQTKAQTAKETKKCLLTH
jgi:hypothetical protein